MEQLERRFLDSLYRGVTDGPSLKRALDQLREMFNCRAAALVVADSRMPARDIALTAGIFDEYGRLYIEQYAPIDPAPRVFANLPTGAASTTDRIMSDKQRNDDPFVNEFFRPIGLVETLGGTLLRERSGFSLIGLQRGEDRAQFDDEDITRIERLMPHVVRSLQLRRAFVQVKAEKHSLQATVDRLAPGVVLLDTKGRAVFVNAAMRSVAGRGDGISLDRAGRPLPASTEARRRLDALLHDVATGGAGGLLTTPRDAGLPDYTMLVAPLPPMLADVEWESGDCRMGALVLVHDPATRTQDAAEILERGLRLPKGAARVVAALAADDDLKGFAERTGVTIHTARFHLHLALSRTGARTQAELVRLAVRLLRDIGLAGMRGDG